jgi:hypothetical protein
MQNLGGGMIVPLHMARIIVVPEIGVRAPTTMFIRRLVEEAPLLRVVVVLDWVTACLDQDRLLDIDAYRLGSSPLSSVGASSREFNQYHPSDLISIHLKEMEVSKSSTEEPASAEAETPRDDKLSEIDLLMESEPTPIHQKQLLDELNPPLIPSPAAGADTLSPRTRTDDLQPDAGHSPKEDASIPVHEINHVTPLASPEIAGPLDTHVYDDWGYSNEEVPSFELAYTGWPENERDLEFFVSKGRRWLRWPKGELDVDR